MADLVAIVEVIRAGIVEIHRSLDEPQPQHADIEIDVSLRIARNRRHMVQTEDALLHRLLLRISRKDAKKSRKDNSHKEAQEPLTIQAAIINIMFIMANLSASFFAPLREILTSGPRPRQGCWPTRRAIPAFGQRDGPSCPPLRR